MRLSDYKFKDNVLVVGNGSCTASDLDNYSTVLRINKGGEYAIRSGHRCDLWLNNMNYSKSYIPDFVPTCHIIRMNYEYGGVRAHRLPKQWDELALKWKASSYNSMVIDLGVARPSSGLMILYYLTSRGSDVSITGYDWYKSHNIYTGHTGEGDPHDWQREKEIILEWVQEGKVKLARQESTSTSTSSSMHRSGTEYREII